MAKFLLVHGSWHGGWCWERLLPILKERGHEAWAPTLIGLGERAGEATPATGLATHVNQIAEMILSDDLKDLTLVGHSYGGPVMVGVAERVPDRISHLVYLDALVPDHGQSAFDLMPGAESGFVQMMRSAGSDFLIPPMSPQELGVTQPADVRWVKTRLTPMPILTHREKVNAPQRKASKIASTYIECLQFGLGAGFAAQARRAGWRVLAADSGHDVMVTNPKGLADLLEQAI
jgi:pimeloyl-ACP methyl ester carboxylesterase